MEWGGGGWGGGGGDWGQVGGGVRSGGTHVQLEAPAKEYFPTGHAKGVWDVLPAAQAYPAWQGPVHRADDRPGLDPNLPAGQLVQDAAPPVLYVPGLQGVAVSVTDPAGHT